MKKRLDRTGLILGLGDLGLQPSSQQLAGFTLPSIVFREAEGSRVSEIAAASDGGFGTGILQSW